MLPDMRGNGRIGHGLSHSRRAPPSLGDELPARVFVPRALTAIKTRGTDPPLQDQRAEKAGIPVAMSGYSTTTPCAGALGSYRHVTEKTFAAIQEHRDAVGAVERFCSDESGPAFSVGVIPLSMKESAGFVAFLERLIFIGGGSREPGKSLCG